MISRPLVIKSRRARRRFDELMLPTRMYCDHCFSRPTWAGFVACIIIPSVETISAVIIYLETPFLSERREGDSDDLLQKHSMMEFYQ